MAEIALTRSDADRRRWRLAGYGDLIRSGFLVRRYEAETEGGERYRFSRTGWRRRTRAVDAAGATVGEFDERTWSHHSGELTWKGQRYPFTSRSSWRQEFALDGPGGPVATVRARSFGRTKATLDVVRGDADPGLVLFVAWLVIELSEEDAAAATSAAVA